MGPREPTGDALQFADGSATWADVSWPSCREHLWMQMLKLHVAWDSFQRVPRKLPALGLVMAVSSDNS